MTTSVKRRLVPLLTTPKTQKTRTPSSAAARHCPNAKVWYRGAALLLASEFRFVGVQNLSITTCQFLG